MRRDDRSVPGEEGADICNCEMRGYVADSDTMALIGCIHGRIRGSKIYSRIKSKTIIHRALAFNWPIRNLPFQRAHTGAPPISMKPPPR
jgi:hypothetical protein